MSVTAAKLDDWYLEDIQCQTETQTVTEGETSKLQWRNHWTIMMVKRFVGMTGFNPENQNVQSSFTFKTGADTTCTWSFGNKKFFCTSDTPRINDTITGEGDEAQTWEHYTDFEDVPYTAYP